MSKTHNDAVEYIYTAFITLKTASVFTPVSMALFIFCIASISVVIPANCAGVPAILLSARAYNAAPAGLKASVVATAVAVEIIGKAKAFILESSIHGIFSSLFTVLLSVVEPGDL